MAQHSHNETRIRDSFLCPSIGNLSSLAGEFSTDDWLYLTVKFVSLVAAFVGTLTIARQKLSYFTTIRTYMASACFMFSAMVATSMVADFAPQFAFEVERFVSTFALISAMLLSFSAVNLVDFPEKRSAKKLLVAAIEKGDYHFLGFLGFMFFGIMITWITQFVQGVSQFTIEPQIIGVGCESWYAAYLFLAIVAIWAHPCYKFFKLYRGTGDAKTRRATFVFFLCVFAIISAALIVNVVSVFLSVIFPRGITSFITAMFYLVLAFVFKETRILTSYFEDFSKSLGLTREQIRGQRILLEFDPRSDYQKVVEDFVDDAAARAEPIVVFSHTQSTIQYIFDERENQMFFLMTPQVSAATKKSKTAFMLPDNASLLLDALDRALKTNSHSAFNVVFDNLFNLVLSIGFDKTYSFLRYALDLMASTNATALFLINPTAHESKIVLSVRSLFGWQLSYGQEGLQVVKLPISGKS